MNGIPSINRLPAKNENAFIPSNIWRKFRTCIVSTSRFLGVLHYYNRKIVLYDVGDGVYEWQGYAEYSHFFRSHGSYDIPGYRYDEDSVNLTRTIDNRHNDLLLYVNAIPEATAMYPHWKYYISTPPKYAPLPQKFKTYLKELNDDVQNIR